MTKLKKIILQVIFLFYRYYDKGSTKSIAFEKAILSVVFLVSLNILMIIVACNLNWNPFKGYSKAEQYLIVLPLVLITSLIAMRFFQKKEVTMVKMNESAMRIGYVWLVLYIIFSVALLVFVILWRR